MNKKIYASAIAILTIIGFLGFVSGISSNNLHGITSSIEPVQKIDRSTSGKSISYREWVDRYVPKEKTEIGLLEEKFLQSDEIKSIIADLEPSEGLEDTDLDNDGLTGFQDLLLILSNWGDCKNKECPWDLNGDGTVNEKDRDILLGDWTNEKDNNKDSPVTQRVQMLNRGGDGGDVLTTWFFNGESCIKMPILTRPRMYSSDSVLKIGYVNVHNYLPIKEGKRWVSRIIPEKATSAWDKETGEFLNEPSCDTETQPEQEFLFVDWWKRG